MLCSIEKLPTSKMSNIFLDTIAIISIMESVKLFTLIERKEASLDRLIPVDKEPITTYRDFTMFLNKIRD